MMIWLVRICFLLVGTSIGLLILEAGIRLHDPFGFRNRGDTIVLPRFKKTDFITGIPGVPEIANIRYNSLGFRGPEPPKELQDRLSVITVGGSTTECMFLSEGMDWPAVMAKHLRHSFPNVWVNNAGIDGHSTRGHIALVDQAIRPLRPDVVIFYTGINEIPGDLLTAFERHNIFDGIRFEVGRDGIMSLLQYSHVLNATYSLVNMYYFRSLTASHEVVNVTELRVEDVSEAEKERHLATADALASGYTERLTTLVEMVRSWGGQVVLATQPMLLGPVAEQ